MSRANWGGGSDLSGIFYNLFQDQEARIAAATARSVRRTEEEQAAQDADTYDRWKNGLIDDETWLAYIRQRVQQSEGDPQDHEKWMETLRQHEFAIRDSQAESAFNNGDISVHAIIGYYQNRLNNLEPNSPEYRDLQQRYWQLVDTRDSDEIYTDAERIIDRIERGQGSYTELLSYYQKRLKSIRKNSDLYRQVTREIDQIQDIVDQTGGSRSSGGGGSRGGGVSAAQASAINEALVSRARGGSTYDSTGSDPIPAIADMFRDDLDAWKDGALADLNRIKAINEQEKNNPTADYLTDPFTGDVYPNSPDFLHSLDDMFLRQEELLFALNWTDGKPDEALAALNYRQQYITDHMQRHNTDNIEPIWREQVNGSFAAIVAASAIADPAQRARMYADIATNLQKHADVITRDVVGQAATGGMAEGTEPTKTSKKAKVDITVSRPLEELPDKVLQDEILWTSQFFGTIGDPSLDVDSRQQALADLLQSRPEGFILTESDLEGYINGGDGTNGEPPIGIMETYAAREGVLTGEWAYMDTGDGILRAMPNDVIARTRNQLNRSGGTEQGGDMVMTFQDVGGETQAVWTMVQPADDSEAYTVWVDKDGKLVPSSKIESMSLELLTSQIDQGLISRRVLHSGWNKIQTADGHVWYQDPNTRLWYRDRVPVRVQRDNTGAVLVSDDGGTKYNYLSFASEAGVIAPYSGITNKEAQAFAERAVESGLISLSQYFVRDQNGDAQFDHPDIAGMYWDPSDSIVDNEFDRIKSERRDLKRADAKVEADAWNRRQNVRRQAAQDNYVNARYSQESQMLFKKMHGNEPMQDFLTNDIGALERAFGISMTLPQATSLSKPQDQRSVEQSKSVLPPVRPAPLSRNIPEGPDLPPLALPQATSGPATAPALPKIPLPTPQLDKIREVEAASPTKYKPPTRVAKDGRGGLIK